MMRLQARTQRWAAIGLAAVMIGGCATGGAHKRGDDAVKRGEWDAAVGYYREALAKTPRAIDVQISLERATREASNQHVARAKELDKQEQLSGAAAEYRLAIEFDPSNSLALTRALEIERRMRDLAEASRPKTRMEEMRAQAANSSPIPRLDPRQPLPGLKFNGTAVRDVLAAIGLATGISVQYDQGLEGSVNRPVVMDLTGHSLESAFNMVLSQNTLTYKILDSHTIFIYADNAGQRAKYEDQYQQTFYLSHAEVTEVVTILNQMLTTTTAGNRPVITQNKSANSVVVRATAPMLGLIKNIVDTADKPRAEVLIEVTILEVSRTRLKDLGIDLNSYSVGLTFAPTSVPTVVPPLANSPINVADLAGSLNKGSFYTTIPSAVVKLMESDQKTHLLAKPQLRGREGEQLTLNLGDSIPVPQTSFLPTATGGVPTQPQVSYAYQPIGVNLTITPKVTYNDEIILAPITVDKSGLGPNMDVAGQSLPTFVKRTAQVSMRLRDGESNLLAGLIKDEDRELGKSLPFITRIPILRSIFGNVNSSNDQSDIVMIVTPHIIRSREITTEDLQPFYVGTQNNLGAGNAPGLISQVPPPAPTQAGQGGQAPPPGGATVGIPPTGAQPTSGTPPTTNPVGNPTTPPAQGAVPPVGAAPPPGSAGRAVGIEPVQSGTGAPPPQDPAGQILLTVPAGELQVGGAPYVVPVSITGVSQVGAVTLTITYDPKVLKATNVSEGTFMRQGGITPVFAPKIDAASGRIDVAISRGGTAPGASGTNLLAGIAFEAIAAGKSTITVTASIFTPGGQAIKVTLPAPGSVIVK